LSKAWPDSNSFQERTAFHYARFEVFMVVKIQVEVFWAVMPCGDVARYCFRRPQVEHLVTNVYSYTIQCT
jgi:hypothetical protein